MAIKQFLSQLGFNSVAMDHDRGMLRPKARSGHLAVEAIVEQMAGAKPSTPFFSWLGLSQVLH